jgi:hypothetical protein
MSSANVSDGVAAAVNVSLSNGLLKPWDGGGFDGSCLPGMTTSVSSLEPARDEDERQLVLKQPFCSVVFQGWFGWSMARGCDGLHEECSAMPEMRKNRWCSWCILEGASRDLRQRARGAGRIACF